MEGYSVRQSVGAVLAAAVRRLRYHLIDEWFSCHHDRVLILGEVGLAR
jgi:hypothetical protein